ncbi:MAG: cation transporter [Clostridia bacterium]|nr:cation transporter [Clostridia bacterium]
MKKTVKIRDLDCAHCATLMEERIRKIDGVESASISFMTQKLVIEAEESRMNNIIEQVAKICKRIEPSCSLSV